MFLRVIKEYPQLERERFSLLFNNNPRSNNTSISYSYSSSSLKKHYLYARNLLLDSFLPLLRIGDTFSRSGSREKNGGRRKTRGGAIWRARVSVHYPRPKYEYKSGWIRVHTMYFWRAFHPESSWTPRRGS